MTHNPNMRPVSRYNERKAKLLATALMEDENALNEPSERWTYRPRYIGGPVNGPTTTDGWIIEVYDENHTLIGHF